MRNDELKQKAAPSYSSLIIPHSSFLILFILSILVNFFLPAPKRLRRARVRVRRAAVARRGRQLRLRAALPRRGRRERVRALRFGRDAARRRPRRRARRLAARLRLQRAYVRDELEYLLLAHLALEGRHDRGRLEARGYPGLRVQD